VGMMMMQSGMVKQSVDYTTSVKALDGTAIDRTKMLFYCKNIEFLNLLILLNLPILPSSSIVYLSTFSLQENQKIKKNHQKMLNVFYAKFIFIPFY
jgi:hypothetical protein